MDAIQPEPINTLIATSSDAKLFNTELFEYRNLASITTLRGKLPRCKSPFAIVASVLVQKEARPRTIETHLSSRSTSPCFVVHFSKGRTIPSNVPP